MNKRFSSRCEPFSALAMTMGLAALFVVQAPETGAQSLWRDETARSMFADPRARAVGDILTIVVQESASTTKANTTKTAKNTSLDAAINTFLYSPAGSSFLTKNGQMPAINMASKNTFDGGGSINNSEKITSRIAVRVTEVLPNGSLVIEGRRQTKFSGESTDAVLRGVVRAQDVTSVNTVMSYNVADATIQYLSKGAVSDSQRKGWFSKIWDKVSPF